MRLGGKKNRRGEDHRGFWAPSAQQGATTSKGRGRREKREIWGGTPERQIDFHLGGEDGASTGQGGEGREDTFNGDV